MKISEVISRYEPKDGDTIADMIAHQELLILNCRRLLGESFWDGFGAAIKIVFKVFDNSPEKETEALRDEIIEEIESYTKGDK